MDRLGRLAPPHRPGGISMKASTRELLPTTLGASVGFVAFVAVGAVPGLFYGGYAGLALPAALFGTPVEPGFWTQLVTFGGMALGLVASLSLFLVIGAVFGTLTGAIIRGVARALLP